MIAVLQHARHGHHGADLRHLSINPCGPLARAGNRVLHSMETPNESLIPHVCGGKQVPPTHRSA